jgi:uncharacterized protein YwgA
MNPTLLGGLIKRLYSSFDMKIFDNRLELQKYIYLMQAEGLNIGYVFSLYIYGPYCTELTKDAFQIENFSKIPQAKFGNSQDEVKFVSYLKFIENRKDDTEWLEIASSLHIHNKLFPDKSKKKLIEDIEKKQSYFKGKQRDIEKVFDELQKRGLLNVN